MSTIVEANLVGGRFTSEASGDPIEVRNPADGEVVGRVPAMHESDVDAVLAAAVDGAKGLEALRFYTRVKTVAVRTH